MNQPGGTPLLIISSQELLELHFLIFVSFSHNFNITKVLPMLGISLTLGAVWKLEKLAQWFCGCD